MLLTSYISRPKGLKLKGNATTAITSYIYISKLFSTSPFLFTNKRKNDNDPYLEGPSVKKSIENNTDKSNQNNDSGSKVEEIRLLQNVHDSHDDTFTGLMERALSLERDVEAATPDSDYVEDSDSEFEGTTELFKFLSKRIDERVEMSDEYLKYKENAFHNTQNNEEKEVESKFSDLIHMLKSTKHDLNTCKVLADHLASGDREEAVEAVKILKQLEKEQQALYVGIHGGEAPYIPDHGTKPINLTHDDNFSDTESNSNEESNNSSSDLDAEKVHNSISDWVSKVSGYLFGGSNPSGENNNDNLESSSSQKDSVKESLIDDFADVSTEPVDYTGGDD